jgi:hypothetical protein
LNVATVATGVGGVAKAILGRAAAKAGAAAGTRTLFRAVGSAELADIEATGAYRIAGNAAEGVKGFFGTAGEASAFARAAQAAGWGDFTITSGAFPASAIESSGYITGEGMAYYIYEGALPGVPVTVIGPPLVP